MRILDVVSFMMPPKQSVIADIPPCLEEFSDPLESAFVAAVDVKENREHAAREPELQLTVIEAVRQWTEMSDRARATGSRYIVRHHSTPLSI
jgi:hypothetical protein